MKNKILNFLSSKIFLEPVLKLFASDRKLFCTDDEVKFSPDTLLSGKILPKSNVQKRLRDEAKSPSSRCVVLRQALIISCSFVFLFSIYLRSIADIGPDTGVYIEIGQKIAKGGRYYYEFFESNFPISFYFYAFEYKIAQLTKINPIILSEIFINTLALLSIFFSSRILKGSTIYNNKAYYNIIIFSYFLGFFLRYPALSISEFGTKTSFLLILFYPYLSYSFQRAKPLITKDLIYLGLLMGLIPCFKPHYLILILAIESFKFWQQKNLKFFITLDKLIMALIGSLYIFLMIKLTPEFFEFIIPMWSKYYASYQSLSVFFNNGLHLASTCLNFVFIFLIFSRKKADYNDRILITSFVGAIPLLILENLGSFDQTSIFYSIATITIFKLAFDFFSSPKFNIEGNKFIIFTIIFLPIFDYNSVTKALFGGGIETICWLFTITSPFIFSKLKTDSKILSRTNFLKSFSYIFPLLLITLLPQKTMNHAYLALGYLISFKIIFDYEKLLKKHHFSRLTVFLIVAPIALILNNYLNSIAAITNEIKIIGPNKYSNDLTYYIKKYAAQPEDKFLVFSNLIMDRYPIENYTKKENASLQYAVVGNANLIPKQSNLLFAINDPDYTFTFSYFLSDTMKQIKDPTTKILFISNSRYTLSENAKCNISPLEYHFLSPAFKKYFLENFHYENTLIITAPKPNKSEIFIEKELKKFYQPDNINRKTISQQFEVYVRK